MCNFEGSVSTEQVEMSAENLLQHRTGLTGVAFQQAQNILHLWFLEFLQGVGEAKVRNYKSCKAFSSFDLSVTRKYENHLSVLTKT